MNNSPLVNHTKISPNSSNPRKDSIKKITIHHVAGNLTVETIGNVFAPASRQASSNYGIGTDGRVGMYVEEKNRAWTSSSSSNDHQAITIEVANDEVGGNWHVSDTALNKLIELCIDICKRNGIDQLNYTGDATGNLTRHNMFANTSCPGSYLQSKFPYIADEVNKKLDANKQPAPVTTSINEGDLVKIASDAIYYNGKSVPAWVKNKNWYVQSISGDRAVIDKSEDGKNSICSPINAKFISVVGAAITPAVSFAPYLVKVTADILNIRKGAGIDYTVTGSIKNKGVYTIVEESNGWGKLKSGAGWISLAYTKKV